MARFRLGDAVDAARHNQIDRREYGVFDYDESLHEPDEGPCAVTIGSSGDTILFDINSGDVQIDGNTVSVPPQSVSADSNNWSVRERKDVITIDENGDATVWRGEAQSPTRYEDDDGDTQQLSGRQAPVPEPPALPELNGVVLAVVSLPPESTNTSDVTQDDIQDRRREALDVTGERNLNVVTLPFTSLESAENNPDNATAGTLMIIPPDSTIELWHWGVGWMDEFGVALDNETGMELRLLDENKDELESTEERWESEDTSEPLFSVSNDDDEPVHYMLQLRNDTDEDFTWNNEMRGLSAMAYYRLI